MPMLGQRATPAAQVILSHTPFRTLAAPDAYGRRPVLAVGRGRVTELAASYGFRAVATPAALAAAHPPSMLPFSGRAMRAAWEADEGSPARGTVAVEGTCGNDAAHAAWQAGEAGTSGMSRSHAGVEGVAALGSAEAPIAAVLVFHDPSDWCA